MSIVDFVKGIPPREGSGPSRDDFMSIGGPGGGKPDPTGGGSDPTESQLNDFIQQFLEGLFGPSSSPQEAPPMPTPTPMPMPNYQDYSINASPQGYNPYLSGQYQSTPYGNAGVPNMGGITTIPVPASYQAPRTMT